MNNQAYELTDAAMSIETASDLFMTLARADAFTTLQEVAKEDDTTTVDLCDCKGSNFTVLKDLSLRSQHLAGRLRELKKRAWAGEHIPAGTIEHEVDACETLINYGSLIHGLYDKSGMKETANVCSHISDNVITRAIVALRKCTEYAREVI